MRLQGCAGDAGEKPFIRRPTISRRAARIAPSAIEARRLSGHSVRAIASTGIAALGFVLLVALNAPPLLVVAVSVLDAAAMTMTSTV